MNMRGNNLRRRYKMTEYGTIKIPKKAYDEHNEKRQELGVTWEEYISGEAPDVSNVSYDDIVQACRKAIRDELPTERV